MSLTTAERSEINRNNARAAKGRPRDTSKTRFNALKHGCRARAIEAALADDEEADVAEAGDRSLVLLDDAAARKFLRYHAEARITFQRSYAALMKAIKSRDAEGSDSPNGAKSAAIATVGSAPADAPAGSEGTESPNGAKSAARSTEQMSSGPDRRSSRQPKSVEKPYDPNEDVAELLVRLIEADQAAASGLEMAPVSVVGDGS